MRMLVFPYGHDCEPIVRYADLLETNYEITALVSPGGWGLAGKHATLGSSGRSLNIYESLQDVSEAYDSLFIPAFEVAEEVEDLLIGQIVKLIPHLRYVYCTATLTDTNLSKLKNACQQASPPCVFTDYAELKSPDAYGLLPPDEKYPSLHQLAVPVVIIAGLWERTDKLEVSLALRERLLKNGYRITQIGSRNGCEMLGFQSFPSFMYCKDVDAADKVFYFNRWIIKIAEKEHPDLVLLTIPGAIQDFSDQFTHGFGLLQNQVFRAVLPDVLIMCTFFSFDTAETLEEISRSCRYRFGAQVDVFHMSNLFIDISASEELKRVVTNSVYRETVSKALKEDSNINHIPIFNALDPSDCDKMFDLIIGKITQQDIYAL